MTYLFPTKTRLELLRAIHAGDVVDGPDDRGGIHTWWIDPPYAPRKVNARTDEIRAAGWAESEGCVWVLTERGHAILGGRGQT